MQRECFLNVRHEKRIFNFKIYIDLILLFWMKKWMRGIRAWSGRFEIDRKLTSKKCCEYIALLFIWLLMVDYFISTSLIHIYKHCVYVTAHAHQIGPMTNFIFICSLNKHIGTHTHKVEPQFQHFNWIFHHFDSFFCFEFVNQ